MNFFRKLGFAALLASLLAPALRAEVHCPAIFSDHMVLQRDRVVPVWGDGEPGERIAVEFAGQRKITIAGASGQWRVTLDALDASAEPRPLTVRGTNTLTYTDVLVGEVWFCSGQSNMEKQLGPRHGQKPTDRYEEEIKQADCPLLRLYQVTQRGKPQARITGLRWLPCSPETVTSTEFSAAAYYFGRELQRKLGVPVGLIHSSFGGTRIEAWMPAAAFAGSPVLQGLDQVPYDHWVEGVQATELYRSMVAPFTSYALRGFLWYQGEANCMNAESLIYAEKQRALIRGWRAAWGEPDAPFFFVLLAPFAYSHQKNWAKQLTPDALPVLWEAQVRALDVPHTGIVATTDLAGDGRDIHPTNKRDVGLRLARLALADTYGWRDIQARSPQFQSFHRPMWSKALVVEFKDSYGLHSSDGQPLTNFEIAGADQKFLPAQVVIKHDKVIVSNPEVPKPVAVRFGWNELAMPNLVNASDLPAIPFRTDDWPLVLNVPKAAPR